MARIDEKIEDYLIRTGSEDGFNTGFNDNPIPLGYQARTDEELFTKAIDLISSLDPESLSDEQLKTVDGIFEDLEIMSEEDIEEEDEESLDEIRYARRTKPKRRRIARMYYRRNKSRVKRARRKFKRSSLGRRRMRIAKRMARSGRTATGRRKVHYRR